MALLQLLLKPIAKHFIGGENLEEALKVVRELNSLRFNLIINYLGKTLPMNEK
jgi:hypothetical protein